MNKQDSVPETLTILSLEDSDLDFEIISEQLVNTGFKLNITRAETEDQFTTLIQNNTYHIILADYNLPQFDAFEALRLCNKHCHETPFICVSGSIGEILAIELLKKGAVDYVIKDRLERLPFAVKRALEEAKGKNNRQKAEKALRISEEKLNYAQEIAKMGSWDFDAVNNTYSWSRNMYQMLRFNPEEVEPTYELFLSRVHPDDKHLAEVYLQQIIRTKNDVSYDFRYLLPNAETIWVQNNITPVFRNDELVEMHGVNIDITDKKHAEQELIKAKEKAEASDRLKTAFLNNVSHEIRTPLNGILGFGQIMLDVDLCNEEKEKYFGMLSDSSNRLINTVTNFMDISMLTSGNQKVHKKEVVIAKNINEVCERFNESCQAKNLTLCMKKPQIQNEYKIYTDENLFGKILHQLIDNAVKFTTNGQIVVGFEKHENTIHFYVKDSGAGISDESKKRIFDIFTQEEIADSRKYEGTGIGLSIAKGLAELLGGKIWMESEKGIGSTFYFSLPFAE